jgi:hypothetical protein
MVQVLLQTFLFIPVHLMPPVPRNHVPSLLGLFYAWRMLRVFGSLGYCP